MGFLFSWPNFNPVVVMMTFTALPLAMALTKYAILLLVILVVPGVISLLERARPFKPFTVGDEGSSCAVTPPGAECAEPFWTVFKELAKEFGRHV